MRTCVVLLLSMTVMCQSMAIDMDKDSKATEAKNSPIVVKEAEKSGKTEKRAPVVMTSVPGELKYESDYKYLPEYGYSPEVNYLSADVKQLYAPQQPIATPKPQFFIYPSTGPAHAGAATTSPAIIPQATYPAPAHQPHAQMILMFAVPHPSGQFLMLLPATPSPAANFIYPHVYQHQPMFYRPAVVATLPPTASGSTASSSSSSSSPSGSHQLYHQQGQQQQLPSSNYYQSAYSPQAHAQAAGFVAQQQLSYAGPYRSEKYSKQ